MREIEKHINQKWNRLKNTTVFVGCSGGLDSMVLVWLLKKIKFNIHILHVNYQLRGEDSENDAKFVEDFCRVHNLPFSLKTIDLGKELESGGNLQKIAREVRYNWFRKEIDKDENSVLAVAHHKDDQIETFFLNLSRKSGVMGLSAMLEENQKTIRPLLPFTKEELKRYAVSENLRWREDLSNLSNKYRRNFLRNILLPLLNYHIPNLNNSILALIKVMQANQLEIEGIVLKKLSVIDKSRKLGIDDFLNWNELLKVEFFRQLNQPIALKNELIKLSTSENGKRILLLKHPVYSAIAKQNANFIFLLNVTNESLPELIVEEGTTLPSEFSKDEIYIDSSRIKGKLKLRKWQIGDRIHPIGMKGSKLISDCIKDAHVPLSEKSNVLVVHDDENIHWCVGFVIGRKAVANKKTNAIVKIKVSK